MLDEREFHRRADKTLEALAERIEAADTAGVLDAELVNGVLTIDLPGGKHYLVSKHAPSRQLWVASPLSGGLHFAYTDAGWLVNGSILEALIKSELAQLARVDI